MFVQPGLSAEQGGDGGGRGGGAIPRRRQTEEEEQEVLRPDGRRQVLAEAQGQVGSFWRKVLGGFFYQPRPSIDAALAGEELEVWLLLEPLQRSVKSRPEV